MLFYIFFFSLFFQSSDSINYAQKIETEIFNYQFDAALKTLKKSEARFSSYRIGTFKAVIYFYRYFSDQPAKRKIQYVDSMQSALQKTIRDEKFILKTGTSDDILMLGGAYGFIGMAEYLKKNRFSALKYADNAKEILEGLIEKDPHAIDAYFGIGIYNYSLSKPPAILRFFLSILGYSGDYNLGIKQLEKVALEGKDTKVQSLLYLINHALYENKYYQKIYPLFNQFPAYLKNSPMYLYKRILFEYQLKMYKETEERFAEISKLKMPKYIRNRSRLTLAKAKIKLKQYAQCDSLIFLIQQSKERALGGFAYEIKECLGDKFFALTNYKKAHQHYLYIYERTSVDSRKERIEKKLDQIEQLTNGELDY